MKRSELAKFGDDTISINGIMTSKIIRHDNDKIIISYPVHPLKYPSPIKSETRIAKILQLTVSEHISLRQVREPVTWNKHSTRWKSKCIHTVPMNQTLCKSIKAYYSSRRRLCAISKLVR